LIARIMSMSPPPKRTAAPSRLRSIVTTLLLVILAVMIVRDIFVRRWGAVTPASPNVTHRDVS
jgi:hypothetical protein